MRVLVTGGAGFVGSHLCERLVRDGHTVICLDNLVTGRAENIAHLAGDRFTFITHDVTAPYDVACDFIMNFACPASPLQYQRDPVRTLKTSVVGAINALDLARRLGVPILQASTSEVYGDPTIHPQPESYWGHVNPIGIRACYDEGKRAAETLFFDYHRQYGVAIKVVRIFNTYGPRMLPDDGRVVSTLIIQALRGEPLTLFGGGSQTRAFCYVDDLVDGLVAMTATGPEVTGPVNLGNPGEFTIAELAALILELTGSRSPIIHAPLPEDDPRQRRPDIGLAKSTLQWEPHVDLGSGLQRTIAYFRSKV
jgi:UDP-glucuronate decarboxylase